MKEQLKECHNEVEALINISSVSFKILNYEPNFYHGIEKYFIWENLPGFCRIPSANLGSK